MPAFDINAYLASNAAPAALGPGADVLTASGTLPPTMEGVPGGRAAQALVWFTGVLTVGSMTIVIEEKIGTGYRPIGIMHFGIAPDASGNWDTSGAWTLDPVGSFASQGAIYHRCIFQSDPAAVALRYNVVEFDADAGSVAGMYIYVIPFEGSGKAVGDPA